MQKHLCKVGGIGIPKPKKGGMEGLTGKNGRESGILEAYWGPSFKAAFRIKIVMRASMRYSQSEAKILLFCCEIGSVSGDRRFFSGSLLSQPRLIIINFLLVLLSGWGTES